MYATAEAFRKRGEFTHAVFAQLAEEPEISKEHHSYWDAFRILESERPAAGLGGVCRIPWSSILKYAEHYGMSFDETERFVDIIREMDATVLKSAESKPSEPKKPSKPK
ncbi:hypothetical protein HT136_08450 [Novosphingobium profundi]|uniref:phage tail assembly chaperone n=1 Tax=Novosphingobium profundi TaxID=1774954 RepID=UPI001BD9DC72|nr:hypothetical protein [Novosphingobium profundi]MBT0668398.1 hypothetical protein [Novosphingobium profundi]